MPHLSKQKLPNYCYIASGEPCFLEGEQLRTARKEKKVMSKGGLYLRQYVDVVTGLKTTLQAEALAAAIKTQAVIHKGNFYARIWVNAVTGKKCPYTGNKLERAIKGNEVIRKIKFQSLHRQQRRNLSKLNEPGTLQQSSQPGKPGASNPTNATPICTLPDDPVDLVIFSSTLTSKEPAMHSTKTNFSPMVIVPDAAADNALESRANRPAPLVFNDAFSLPSLTPAFTAVPSVVQKQPQKVPQLASHEANDTAAYFAEEWLREADQAEMAPVAKTALQPCSSSSSPTPSSACSSPQSSSSASPLWSSTSLFNFNLPTSPRHADLNTLARSSLALKRKVDPAWEKTLSKTACIKADPVDPSLNLLLPLPLPLPVMLSAPLEDIAEKQMLLIDPEIPWEESIDVPARPRGNTKQTFFFPPTPATFAGADSQNTLTSAFEENENELDYPMFYAP